MSSFKETKDLPLHLKKLLPHFELFPRDFDIAARRLVTLWVSEGLIEKGTEENETLEQVAEKCLSELVDLGIVQIVKKKASGKVKTCHLPVRTKPRYLDFSHNSQLKLDRVRSVQRLAHHFNKSRLGFCLVHSDGSSDELKKLYSFLPYNPREGDEAREGISSFLHTGGEFLDDGSKICFRLDYRNLRCFHTFDPREGDEPGETIGKFLRNGIKRGFFQQLQVLDLERTFKPELPNCILKKLKYLGLRWTYLQSIPSSIGDLVHLETLDLKHTCVRTLPSSVWKLQRLRNLYLNHSNRCKFVRQPRGSFLKNLQTLWGVFVDEDSPLKDCLDKLIDLRKLGMVFQLDVSKQKRLLSPWISKLNHLQTLRLRSIDETGKPDKLFVKLSSLENLSSIELFGRLENPLITAELPQKLTELTLSASGLIDDPLPKLEKLPNLKLLCFYSNSYKGRRMVCSDEGFPKLVVLKIWKLEELEELIVQEKALQSLRELEIRACTKLIIPYGLKNLKMLLELKLTDMPDEFARKIENDRRQIWSNNIHSPTINILHQS